MWIAGSIPFGSLGGAGFGVVGGRGGGGGCQLFFVFWNVGASRSVVVVVVFSVVVQVFFWR